MGQEELNYYTYNSKPEKKYLQISTNISMSHAELNYHTNNNKPEKIYVHKICVALMPKQQQYFDRWPAYRPTFSRTREGPSGPWPKIVCQQSSN